MEPEILLFDEPTAGLDPITAELINNLIRQCHNELDMTTFTITHDLSTVHTVADRVGVLNDGRIIWSGELNKMHQSQHPFIQNSSNNKPSGLKMVKKNSTSVSLAEVFFRWAGNVITAKNGIPLSKKKSPHYP